MPFGDFGPICDRAPLPLCALIRPMTTAQDDTFKGVLPQCYARTVNLANTLIFEIGTAFTNIAMLAVLLLIVYMVRLRYTSVARREMLCFFWAVIAYILGCLVVDTGVSPPGAGSYPYFVAFQIASASVCCFTLLFSGLCGLSLWEDGSKKAMLALTVVSTVFFAVNYIVAIFTFDGIAGLSQDKTVGLFVLYFIVNGIMLVAWLASQLFVCFFVLEVNWWAIGALGLTTFFFVASQLLVYAFSNKICESLKHYVDGMIFSAISAIFCVMMLFKYWDIITFDDDEYYRHTEVVPGVTEKEARQMMD